MPQGENGVTKEYADEAAVVERDESVYRYAADGTGVKTETTVLRVQSSAALQAFAVLGFPYASGTQSLEIVMPGCVNRMERWLTRQRATCRTNRRRQHKSRQRIATCT